MAKVLFIIFSCFSLSVINSQSMIVDKVIEGEVCDEITKNDAIAMSDGDLLLFNLSAFEVVAQESIKSLSSTSVVIAKKKDIEHQAPLNVGAVLQQHSGFTTKDSYQTPITLRGLSGKRLLTLRNGLRRMSSYSGGYMAHLVNVYDLDRIEIEKGYSSVEYGAGAIAGTINMIDKPLFAHDRFNGKLSYGHGGNNNENSLLACSGWNNDKLALKGGLRYRQAGNSYYSDGSEAVNSDYLDKDIFIATGFKFSDLDMISFTGDWHGGGPWGKPLGFNGSNYMKIRTLDEQSHNYQMHYQRTPKSESVVFDVKAFYSTEGRELQKAYYTAAGYQLSYLETTHFSDYYYGVQAKSALDFNSQHHLVSGVEAYAFHISTPTDGVDYIEDLSFSNRVSKNARLKQVALFAEHRFAWTSQLTLKGGVRYDYARIFEGEVHDLSEPEEGENQKNAFSGHLAFDYKYGSSRVKLNFARSFRMPSTTEMYTDSYTANGIVYATPGLKAEYCNSIDLALRYFKGNSSLEISPFLWLMDDMISREEILGLPGTNYQYINIGKSLLTGGEINLLVPVKPLFSEKDELRLECGVSYLYGNDLTDSENVEPLDYLPPLNVKSALHYSRPFGKDIKFKWSVRSVYYAQQYRLPENGFSTLAYVTFSNHISLNFLTIKTQPTLNFTITNLLNNEYYTYQSYLPSPGRSCRVFISFRF